MALQVHEMKGFRGAHFSTNPAMLPQDILANAQNAWSPRDRLIGKRPGSIALASLPSGATFSRHRGLTRFYRSNGNIFTVWAVEATNGNLAFYRVSDSGTVTSIGGGTTLSAGDVSFAVYADTLYASNGTAGPIKQWTGTGFMTDVAGGWSSGRRGAYLTVYFDRLISAGGSDLPGTFYFSDTFGPTSLTSGNQYERLGDRSNDVITGVALHGVQTDTSGLAAGILFFKRDSTWLLKGNTSNTGSIDQISGKVGCASAKTIANTPFGVIFLGHDDIYWMRAEGEPVAIGGPIRTRILGIPAAQRARACAAYHNWHYKIWFAQSGASVNNDCYWLDLRNFPDVIAWWGPMRNTSGSTVLYGFDFVTVLQGSDRPSTNLSSDVNAQAIAAETGRNRLVWLDQNVYTDQGTAISMIVRSHQFGADNLWQEKIIRKWGGNFRSDPGQSLTADVVVDDNASTYSTTVSLSASGAQWDVAQWDVDAWSDTYFQQVVDSLATARRGAKADLAITHSASADLQIDALQLAYEISQRFMEDR